MQFFISYKSLSYRIRKSPIITDWAFLLICHVSRSISEQCSTILISPGEQSDQPYGLKNRLQKPLFSGSGSTCSGIGIRLGSAVVNPSCFVLSVLGAGRT